MAVTMSIPHLLIILAVVLVTGLLFGALAVLPWTVAEDEPALRGQLASIRPPQLPRAGCLPVDPIPGRPLVASEVRATTDARVRDVRLAGSALERDIQALTAAAEARIPARWRR